MKIFLLLIPFINILQSSALFSSLVCTVMGSSSLPEWMTINLERARSCFCMHCADRHHHVPAIKNAVTQLQIRGFFETAKASPHKKSRPGGLRKGPAAASEPPTHSPVPATTITTAIINRHGGAGSVTERHQLTAVQHSTSSEGEPAEPQAEGGAGECCRKT